MMQQLGENEKVAQRNGGSNIFEGRCTATSGIVKIHFGFEAFLTPQNQYVRATTGIVQRAERCTIEEIGLK